MASNPARTRVRPSTQAHRVGSAGLRASRVPASKPAGALPDVLTAPQAAKLLGVSSANTVKNWLEGGMFPGAFRTPGGHWRFPKEQVLEARARMETLAARQRAGDLTPPDLGDDAEDPPAL